MMRRCAYIAILAAVVSLVACNRSETPPDRSPTLPEQGTDAVPTGMVHIPGGTTDVGSTTGRPHEQPVFQATVDPFYLDRHPVTVAQFRAFVEEVGYVTEAERFGNAGVFDQSARAWVLVDSASWRRPLGPGASPAPDDHPVTQVSWNDAVAYCAHVGKRLPSEVEWEHAARGASNQRRPYAWGTELVQAGQPRANTWTGTFPVRNTEADGYRYTSPVGAFGETDLGLTDMGGNVWEWTADWYRSYADRDRPFVPTATSEKVQRGGSFMCHPSYCHGYRVSARSHSTPETSLFHVGFRCAKTTSTR